MDLMARNQLLNDHWLENENQCPKYYQLSKKIHFDHTLIGKTRVCSLQLEQGEEAFLSYVPVLLIEEAQQVTLGLVIRGNDLSLIHYMARFFDKEHHELKCYRHNVAPEITTEFKQVCVTYKIPPKAVSLTVQWEFKGLNTAVTFFRPSVRMSE